MADGSADAVDHRECVRIASLLHHGQIDGTLSIDADDVVLQRMRVLELSNVRHEYRAGAVHFDWILAGVLQVELRIRVDVVVKVSDLDVAGRQDHVRLTERPNYVHGADLPRFELERIDIELDLPPRSAERLRNRRAGNTRQLVANEILRDVLQIAICHALAIHGDQADGKTRRVGLQDDGRQGAGRQVFHVRHGKAGDGRGVDVRVRI